MAPTRKRRLNGEMAEKLSFADIASVSIDDISYNQANTVIPKIRNATKDPRFAPNHHIDCKRYTSVYATSDLHADYRNFMSYLLKLNLIELPNTPDIYDKTSIYDPRFIVNAKWIPENTILIILGDLVDGKRLGSVFDTQGSFELYIHMFIYNLRLSAMEKNSDIRFLAGNHDINTVLNTANDYMYNLYIPDEAKRFFGHNKQLRAKCLETFYLLSPYLYLTLDKDSVPELFLVHGGFHQKNLNPYAGPEFDHNLQKIIRYYDNTVLYSQDEMWFALVVSKNNANKAISLLSSKLNTEKMYVQFVKTQPPKVLLDKLEADQIMINNNLAYNKQFPSLDKEELRSNEQTSPLWSRYYMESIGADTEEDMCKYIKDDDTFKNSTIIVGHCPTTFDEFKHKKTDSNGADVGHEYYKCVNHDDNTGCVITACDMDNQTKIIFVDTALSSAFRKGTTLDKEKARDSEIIVLKHTGKDDQYGRFYNEISRLRTTGYYYVVYPLSESFEWRKVAVAVPSLPRIKGGKRKTKQRRKLSKL